MNELDLREAIKAELSNNTTSPLVEEKLHATYEQVRNMPEAKRSGRRYWQPKWRFRPAAVLAPALLLFAVPVIAPYFGAEDVGMGLVVYAGELDLTAPSVADGAHLESFGFEYDDENGVTFNPALLFHFGEPDDENIKSVTLRCGSGKMSSYLEVERRASGMWNRINVSVPFGDWYKERTEDPESPTDAEIMAMLAELDGEQQLLKDLSCQVDVDGQIQENLDFSKLPDAPSEVRVMHKLDADSGLVLFVFDNPESNVRDFIIDVKELTVVPYEEVWWRVANFDAIRYADPENVDFTAYGDEIEVEAVLNDGRIARGTVHIEFDESGEVYVRYTEES